MMKVLIIIIIVLIFIILLYSYIVLIKVVKKSKRTIGEELDYLTDNKIIEKGYYEGLNKILISIKSKDGLRLKGFIVKTQMEHRGTIILSHGVSCNNVTMIKHIEMFNKIGFDAVLIDHRCHGESEGNYITYGYKEKEDLNLWIEYVRDELIEKGFVGVMGESMGASIALETTAINNRIDFIISECAFSTFSDVLKIYFGKIRIPYSIFGNIASGLSYLKFGFTFDGIKPIEAVKNTNIPILFIHGDMDEIAPFNMSLDMHKANNYLKKLYILEGVGHRINCGAILSRENYEKEIIDFINEVILSVSAKWKCNKR